MNLEDIIKEIDQQSVKDRWMLVRYLIQSLEREQEPSTQHQSWQDFLRQTYGSTRDTPIERWEQGEYEERETLE